MFIFSPIGRWLAAAGGALSFLVVVYLKGRSEGKETIRRNQESERARRAKNAIQADDSVRRDVAAGRLYETDGHRRD